jgi:hypothetical protein
VGLTVAFVLELPGRTFEFTFLGSEAAVFVSGTWLFALVLVALTAAGVEAIARAHPRVHLSVTQYTFILWILPCIIVLSATVILPAFTTLRGLGMVGIAFTGVLLTVVVTAEYHTIDLRDRNYAAAHLVLNLAAYLAALFVFTTLYALKLRTILSAPMIGVVSGLLALELARGSESDVGRTWLYATAIGLAMGEVLWAMNYWIIGPFAGGVLLLLIFYILTGIVQQHLAGHWRRWMLLEFATVVVVAILLLYRFKAF